MGHPYRGQVVGEPARDGQRAVHARVVAMVIKNRPGTWTTGVHGAAVRTGRVGLLVVDRKHHVQHGVARRGREASAA
jgi:hypothetical protein